MASAYSYFLHITQFLRVTRRPISQTDTDLAGKVPLEVGKGCGKRNKMEKRVKIGGETQIERKAVRWINNTEDELLGYVMSLKDACKDLEEARFTGKEEKHLKRLVYKLRASSELYGLIIINVQAHIR